MSPTDGNHDIPFVFIHEIGDEEQRRQRKAKDGKTIRRQAMRYAVRQKSNEKTPTFKFLQYSGTTKKNSRTTDEAENTQVQSKALIQTPGIQSYHEIAPNMRPKGYEHARMQYKFDILSLSALTTIYMGRGSATVLYNTPSKRKEWMQSHEPSYIEFLPAQYESSALLRSVIDATLARAHHVLCDSPAVSELTVLRLYGVALRGLQEALNDPVRALDAEVLCASQVFQLFEVSSVISKQCPRGDADLGQSFWTFPILGGGPTTRLVLPS
jgi:hypothetical protein